MTLSDLSQDARDRYEERMHILAQGDPFTQEMHEIAMAEAVEFEREREKQRQEKARVLLDNLGGAVEWKDAKLDWEDEP